MGDSQQPAAPGVRAFRAPQRYLHLPGLGASAAAGQGKASWMARGGWPLSLSLSVSWPGGARSVIARGPPRPGARRHRARWRRALGPHRQPRAWPVLRATREGAAGSDGQRTEALLAGSMWSGPSRRGGRHVRRGPGSPRSGFLLPGLALLLALFRALAFDRAPPWGCIVLLRPLPSSSALRWAVRMNKSISLLPDTPSTPHSWGPAHHVFSSTSRM